MRAPATARAHAPAAPRAATEPPESADEELVPPNSVLAHLLTLEDREPAPMAEDRWPLWLGALRTDAPADGEGDAVDLELDLELEEIELDVDAPEDLAGGDKAPSPEDVAAEQEADGEPAQAEQDAEAAAQEAAAEPGATEEQAPATDVPGALTAPAPAAVAGAAGKSEGRGASGPTLAAWSAKVREATAAQVVAPPAPDATQAAAPIKAVGAGAKTRERARRKNVTADVEKAMPKAPEPPEGIPPPPPIPVPAAETAVAAALGKQLPPQTMPEVRSYTHMKADGTPQVFTPPVGAQLAAGTTATLQMPPPPGAPAGKEGAAAIAAVRKAGDKIEEGKQGSGQIVLGTAPAAGTPGAPPGPPVKKGDVAKVLGRLRASAARDARDILVGARESAYPRKALQMQLPDFASDLVTGIHDAIGTSISTIASQAGIDAAALEAATAQATASVEESSTQTKEQIAAAEAESKETVDGEGKASAAAIASARDAADDAAYEKAAAAEGGVDPEAIRARRDRLVERAYGRLAPEDLRYEREGDDRLRALALVEASYTGGYVVVARQVADLIAREAAAAAAKAQPAGAPTPASGSAAGAPPPPAPPPAPRPPVPPSPAEQWAMDRRKEATEEFAKLRESVTTTTKEHRDAIQTAKTAAHDLIHDWADAEIDERCSWWESLWHQFQEWLTEAQDSTKAWQEARDAMLLADLEGDLTFMGDITSGARSVEELRAQAAMGGLSTAQQAIMKSYFEGPDKGNPLAAVAAGMRVRIAEGQRDTLITELQTRLMALGPADWRDVAAVAQEEGGGVNIKERGNKLYAAVDQWGTDEDAVYEALSGLTALQRHALDLWYQAEHGRTIQSALDAELSDSELDRAEDLMKGDAVAADAAALHTAIDGAGTNEAEIWRALRNKTPEERARLEQIYLERYGETLESALKGDLSDEELARGMALKEGNVAKADAIGLEMATTGKWHGGADMKEVEAIYATIRAETEQEAAEKGWTSEQLRQELLKRNGKVADEHQSVYPEKGGLQASFKTQLKGPELDLALGLADVDMARADAARLEIERRGFYTDDDVVNGILETQYTRARSDVTLDLEHDLRRRRELAGIRGEKWDDEAERAAMAGRIDALAAERSQRNMQELEATYDKSYSRWGSGGLQVLIALNMSGTDRDKARDLVKQGGKLRPDQEIFYAVEGAGTDVDAIKKTLQGKSPAEVKAMEDAWDKRFPHGPKLRDRVMGEVSGRDTKDLDILLRGEPRTPKEKLELAKEKLEYEQSAYALGGAFSDRERRALEAEVAALEETVAKLDHVEKGSEQEAYLLRQVDQGMRGVESDVEEHRRSVDSLADTAAMVASIAAAVAVTILTAGTAGPAIVGLMAAVAATQATIVTKLLLKGSALSEEEVLVDVASGVVDAVMAVATAGVGNALMRVADGIPIGPLAKLATSPSATKRMLAHGVAEGVEGFVSSLPSAVVGTMVDEKTWRQGNMLDNVVMGVGMGVGMGTLMSGGMGALGGRAKTDAPGAPRLDTSRPVDLKAAADMADGTLPPAHADPSSRAAQWHAQRAANPDIDYDTFVRDLEAGRIVPDADAAPKFQRALQDELSAGLPPGRAQLLDGVPVEVLSDAEFERLTRSASGQAVTVIDGGKPRILMREGADIHVLREEGIHAAQILDTKTARTAAKLDEANMARWDSLPLGTKIEMYRAKLELEIDAQHTLLASLKDSAEGLPPGPARQAIADQLDAATRNLDNLAARQVELDGFTMLDRLRARLGRGPLAERLEQPPRLFQKKAKTVPAPVKGKKPAAPPATTPAKKQPPVPAAKPPPVPKAKAAATPVPPKPRFPKPKTDFQATVNRLDPHRIDLDAAEVARIKSDPNVKPVPLADGPSSLRCDPDTTPMQIGEVWTEKRSLRGPAGNEPHPDGVGDLYRIVEIEQDGVRVRIEETVVRGSDPMRWTMRGKEIAKKGRVAEEASIAQTQRMIAAAPPKQPIFTLGDAHQRHVGSGNGFDEVYFKFGPDGSVDVVIVEVKHYGGWVPFKEFTAVTQPNLKRNLATLQDLLAQPKGELPESLRGMSKEQLDAVKAKLAAARKSPSKLTLEVRPSPGTLIGKQQGRPDTAPTMTLLKREKKFGKVVEVPVDAKLMGAAEALADIKLEPAARARFIELHASAGKLAHVQGPFRPVPGQPGVLRHGKGAGQGVALLKSVTPQQVSGKKLDDVAADIVAAMRRQIHEPGYPKRNLHVLLDTSSLRKTQRAKLDRAITKRLKASRQFSALSGQLTLLP